jgi:16S rRNA (guanine966-N2)-methyltransferase
MRIISGSRRGRKLISFDGDSIRPTTDRVKESIFNLIQEFTLESSVLDLFGGSGALSLEALSRGAKSAVIIDSSKSSVEIINKNISLTGFEDGTEVFCVNAQEFILNTSKKFDIIFLDPPYNKGFIVPILTLIAEKGLLSENGIAVLESDFCDEHGEIPGLDILKQRKYGRTYITIYKRKPGYDIPV